MYSWIHNALNIPKTAPRPLPDKPVRESEFSGWFSTHSNLTHAERQSVIQSAFEVTPDDFEASDVYGMDSVIDNSSSAKNMFSIGHSQIPEKLLAWYASQSFIGYQSCALISQHWLINRCCNLKGRDAVRNGFNLVFGDGVDVDPKIYNRVERLNKQFDLKKNITRADKFKNVFGISHILFDIDSPDPDYYEKPFNPDGISPGSYKGMINIDPYWVTPLLTTESVENPGSGSFYDPMYWVVSGRKYHKSHFVTLKGPEVPDLLKPTYLYGGLPLTQLILERVYAAERTANEAPQLALTKRLLIRYMEDLESVALNPDEFERSMTNLSEWRDNYGVYVESNENRIEQQDTSLSDFDSMVMTQYQIVAGQAGIPATKLLGTSPKGFQSTGEHEIKSYHEELESIQHNDLEPIIDQHHKCLMQSHILPNLQSDIPLDISIVWRPLAVMSDKEQAETNDIKSRTAATYANTGAIDAYDIRDSLITDEDSGFSGIEEVERPDDIEALETPEPEPEQQPGGFTPPDSQVDQQKEPKTTYAQDFVRKENRKWYVYSRKGKKLDGPFNRKYLADNRLREIEAAKED